MLFHLHTESLFILVFIQDIEKHTLNNKQQWILSSFQRLALESLTSSC